MKSSVTPLLWSGALLAVLTAVLLLPEGLRQAGPEEPLGVLMIPGGALDPDIAVLSECSALRQRVTEDVLAGRLTLLEAAACFRAINQQRPNHLALPLATLYPGATEEERLCWLVIWFIEGPSMNDPDRAALVDCLKAELEEHLVYHGVIHMPEGLGEAIVGRF
jgi:hypothetical protein